MSKSFAIMLIEIQNINGLKFINRMTTEIFKRLGSHSQMVGNLVQASVLGFEKLMRSQKSILVRFLSLKLFYLKTCFLCG